MYSYIYGTISSHSNIHLYVSDATMDQGICFIAMTHMSSEAAEQKYDWEGKRKRL